MKIFDLRRRYDFEFAFLKLKRFAAEDKVEKIKVIYYISYVYLMRRPTKTVEVFAGHL